MAVMAKTVTAPTVTAPTAVMAPTVTVLMVVTTAARWCRHGRSPQWEERQLGGAATDGLLLGGRRGGASEGYHLLGDGGDGYGLVALKCRWRRGSVKRKEKQGEMVILPA